MIKTWHFGMSDADSKDLAYWERNCLALHFADGWYNDDENGYAGWRRVLSLEDGAITFHIPDGFDIGDLKKLEKPTWDGHTTEEKWQRILDKRRAGG